MSAGKGSGKHLSRRSLAAGVAVATALAAVLLPSRLPAPRGAVGDVPVLDLGPDPGSPGFTRADGIRDYRLPEDHGPHFAYQTEWWYYTGNLAAADGRRYGFQLTFFRRGLSPGPPPDGPGLGTNQVYFAHLAVTDVAAGNHRFAERWARGAGGLAGARAEPYAVWLEDWRADSTSAEGDAMRILARDGRLFLDLHLESRKPLVRHGNRGLSPKSDEPGNASHYVGYTRLQARGRLGSAEGEVAVSGEAWFDHEWSTSALGRRAVGWDWFSLQTDDGRELMYFQIRRDDGSVEPVSQGTLVDENGDTRRLAASELSLGVLARWTSPETGATYPARWRLRVPAEGLDLLVEPRVADQEMRTSFVYWEGVVQVSGTREGRAVRGHGYVELTGYARSMQGVF